MAPFCCVVREQGVDDLSKSYWTPKYLCISNSLKSDKFKTIIEVISSFSFVPSLSIYLSINPRRSSMWESEKRVVLRFGHMVCTFSVSLSVLCGRWGPRLKWYQNSVHCCCRLCVHSKMFLFLIKTNDFYFIFIPLRISNFYFFVAKWNIHTTILL